MVQRFFPYETNSNWNFKSNALACFEEQASANEVFNQFLRLARYNVKNINSLTALPFLPVEFFKTHNVQTGGYEPETIFYSSGTTNQTRAAHPVKHLNHYHQNTVQTFAQLYGHPESYAVLGLLPSYLENPNASLVSMVQHFINLSPHTESGFFLDDHYALAQRLQSLEARNIPTLLIGVSFALLAFAHEHPMPLKHTIIMETGGMKGFRRELVRAELHQMLKEAFNCDQIHAEYGMTELMSQAYAVSDGLFRPPPWMQVLVRNPYDPFNLETTGKGALNIIDLANQHSCAFLATQDLGTVYEDGSFEVLGRFDHAELRGCNLMVPE